MTSTYLGNWAQAASSLLPAGRRTGASLKLGSHGNPTARASKGHCGHFTPVSCDFCCFLITKHLRTSSTEQTEALEEAAGSGGSVGGKATGIKVGWSCVQTRLTLGNSALALPQVTTVSLIASSSIKCWIFVLCIPMSYKFQTHHSSYIKISHISVTLVFLKTTVPDPRFLFAPLFD